MKEVEKQCIAYFKSSEIFDQLLRGFRRKYRSYGEFSGSVTVRFKDEEEREILEGLLQKNYHGKKTAAVSAAAFEKALSGTRFGDMTGKHILELYFQEEMTGKREEKDAREKQWDALLSSLEREYAGSGQLSTPECKCAGRGYPSGLAWLEEIKEQKKDRFGFQSYIKRRAREETEEKILRLGLEVLYEFDRKKDSGESEYLPVFAARMTGNPHAFDDKRRDGHYLQMLVKWWSERQGHTAKNRIFPAEERQKQYLAAGIIRDEISNYVMLCGVTAKKKNGEMHRGMEGFAREGEMLHVPLAALAGWDRIQCPENVIYIVENPSIYAMLCGKWKGKRAVMCMNGQPRLSAVLALDLLARSGTTIYYGGDFDPEGLLIAQKVKDYYDGNLSFWHMTEEEYLAAGSEEIISERRLRMLEKIVDEELVPVAEQMKKIKRAGYQENIWRHMEEESNCSRGNP